MRNEEYSDRALDLTTAIIEDNPAHYSIWEYRRNIIAGIGHLLKAELQYLDSMIEENPKNYQLW